MTIALILSAVGTVGAILTLVRIVWLSGYEAGLAKGMAFQHQRMVERIEKCLNQRWN